MEVEREVMEWLANLPLRGMFYFVFYTSLLCSFLALLVSLRSSFWTSMRADCRSLKRLLAAGFSRALKNVSTRTDASSSGSRGSSNVSSGSN